MALTKQALSDLLEQHFAQLAQYNYPPLELLVNDVRLNFINYCITHYKTVDSPEGALIQYLDNEVKEQNAVYTAAEMNKIKLMILWSSLSALSFKYDKLALSSIAVGYLINKIQTIKDLPDDQVALYLDELLKETIHDYKTMAVEDFCQAIQSQYQAGVQFHCFMKENFLNDVQPEKISKRSESPLFFFLPDVFCQQHINSCVIATEMSLLRQVVSDVDQFQAMCRETNDSTPTFSQSWTGDRSLTADNLRLYQQQFFAAQRELECALDAKSGGQGPLYPKTSDSFSRSCAYHIASWPFIKGREYQLTTVIDRSPWVSHFQQKIVKQNSSIKLKNLNTVGSVKKLFLYDRQALLKESIVGHALIVAMDQQGQMMMIEHKNNYPQTLLLQITDDMHVIRKKATQMAHDELFQFKENIDELQALMLQATIDDLDLALNNITNVCYAQISDLYQHKPTSVTEYYALIALQSGTYAERLQQTDTIFKEQPALKTNWEQHYQEACRSPEMMQTKLSAAKMQTLQTVLQQQQTQFLLNLKLLIEETPWKVGRLGGETIYLNNGQPKQNVPQRIAKIYQVLKEFENGTINLARCLNEVTSYANSARPRRFNRFSLTKRDEKTQAFYDKLTEKPNSPKP